MLTYDSLDIRVMQLEERVDELRTRELEKGRKEMRIGIALLPVERKKETKWHCRGGRSN